MGLAAIVLVSAVGGIYYLSKLAPRVAQRMNTQAASSGTASSVTMAAYRQYEHGFLPTMSRQEALLVLGFSGNTGVMGSSEPSVKDIKQRYRELMVTQHSDVSGSPYIATKINEARQLLLNNQK
eukprot:TRINITY_DN11639_c0_g1_i2.p1 TRINITY_DN11639_c0_g1~~TRINITY_DN11639_c0_g1_i2.p1  ORF type:complete len:124 (+),score=30.93 TRINITY_DN11639_c0_g1_i2:324-695(+)